MRGVTADLQENEAPSIFSLGLTLFFAWLVLFFALVRSNYSLVAPAAAILILMHGTRFWSRIAVTRLGLILSPDRTRLFPDESLVLTVGLHNAKLLPIWLQLQLGTPLHLMPEQALEGETRLFSYQKSSRDFRLTAIRRGVVALGPATVVAGDLLGLHRRIRRYPSSHEIVIFPHLRKLQPLYIPFQEYFGIHASKGLVEDPAWYAGTRDYCGNRPARNIHWKASARLGVLQEKLYEPTSHRKVLFVLDCRGFGLNDSMPDTEDLERMIEAVASVAVALMDTGASFGFVTDARIGGSFASLLPMGRGPEHLGVVLEMLARLEPTSHGNLDALLREAIGSAMGVVYFGAQAGEQVRSLFAPLAPRRRRMFFIFAAAATDDRPVQHAWDGCPAYLTREVIDVRGA